MPSDIERIAWCLLIPIVLVGVTIFLFGLFILLEVYLVLFASIISAFNSSSSEQNRDEIFLWCWAVVHLPIVLVIVILVAKVYFSILICKEHPFLSSFFFGLMLTVLQFEMYHLPHGLTLFSEWFTLAGDLSNVETTRSQQSRYTMSLLAMLVIIGIVINCIKMLKKEDVLLKHNAIVRTADIKFAESSDVTSISQISKRVTNDAEIKDDLLKVTMNEQESTNDSQVAKETGENEMTNQIDRAESSPPLESNERVTNDAKIKDDLLKVTINEQESPNDPQVAKETGEKINQIDRAESSPPLESNERATNDAEIKDDLLKVSINEQESPNDPQVAKETGENEKINQIDRAESSPPLESNESDSNDVKISSVFPIYYHVCQARNIRYFTIRFKRFLEFYESRYNKIQFVNSNDVLILHYRQTSPLCNDSKHIIQKIPIKDISSERTYSFNVENEDNVPRIVMKITISVENTPAVKTSVRLSMNFGEQPRCAICSLCSCQCDQNDEVKNVTGVKVSGKSQINFTQADNSNFSTNVA